MNRLIPPKSQHEHYEDSRSSLAAVNELMLEFLFGTNPITDDELLALIEKRPELYGHFRAYVGTRGEKLSVRKTLAAAEVQP